MTHQTKSNWWSTLNAAQRATVQRIRREHTPSVRSAPDRQEATDGWAALMMPTTGPATYLELRHYLQGGGLARWVIEVDGSVSATNEQGQRRGLIAA